MHRPWLFVVSGFVCLVGACSASDLPSSADVAARQQEVTTPGSSAPGAKPFTAFESGQVRPLALSPDGEYLYAVNTPDNRLEIFKITAGGLQHRKSVPVGLEPVAVAARGNAEVWVVNHLSDSVSIVDVDSPSHAHVVRTLLVGDEPRDIVFAGPSRRRAFITAAHRGQNGGFDPQLTTEGIGRADVWVFDANNLGSSLGGTPLTRITLFTDAPRALAVTPDGSKVYAAGFHTGNRTTIIDEVVVTANGGLPPPFFNAAGEPQPTSGLIVKFDGAHWLDELGRVWDDFVKLSLPDRDVFVIDANASPPAQLAGAAGSFQGVGTVLFNMAVNPKNGKVYVTNTDALNEDRFEGAGVVAGHTVRGRFIRNRITVLAPGSVQPRHLNKHIDYDACCAPIPNAENAASIAIPTDLVVSKNGKKLYVAALGSNEVAVYDTAKLEADTFVPSVASQIPVTGGGPTGLALDEKNERLYVLTRFDNAISIIDTATGAETDHVAMYNPEPPSVVAGRRFLYDASFTSSHGDSACASCHVFGDVDSLAWDLGDPDGATGVMPGPFTLDPLLFFQQRIFASNKGPMTTQSLRGMANHGPMHWRGDRTGGNDAPSAQPDSGTFDEAEAFRKFRVAFVGLLGRDQEIPEADLQKFTDFILQVAYPPNPIRNLDNTLTASQQAGADFFFGSVSDPAGPCSGCHTVDPTANIEHGVAFPGFFGTDGRYSAEPLPQPFKVPHLRNLYTKVGMFGVAPNPSFEPGDFEHTGEQVRGFGYLHDGGHDTIFRFNRRDGFSQNSIFGHIPDAFPDGAAGDPLRRQVEDFILAFDSNLAPIVGQGITLGTGNAAVIGPRIDLLRARALAGECDLVVKGQLAGDERGYLLLGNGRYTTNRAGSPTLTEAALRATVTGPRKELTYTCVPPGSGTRIALDRDEDGLRDGDEADLGSDPANPNDPA